MVTEDACAVHIGIVNLGFKLTDTSAQSINQPMLGLLQISGTSLSFNCTISQILHLMVYGLCLIQFPTQRQ